MLSHNDMDTVYALARVARRYDPGINDFYFVKDFDGAEHLVFRNTRRDLYVIVAEVVPHEDAATGRLEAFRYFPERNTFRRDYGASDNLLVHQCYQAYDAVSAVAASASAAATAPFRWLVERMTPRPAGAGHAITFPHRVPNPAAAKPAVHAHYHAHNRSHGQTKGQQPSPPTKQPGKSSDSRRDPGHDPRRDSGRMI